jgi:subtilisin family serine protease
MKRAVRYALIASLFVLVMLATTANTFAAPGETVRIFVEYVSGQGPAVQAALNRAGAQFHYDFAELNSYVVTLPAAALAGIQHNPHVVGVEADVPRTIVGNNSAGLYAQALAAAAQTGEVIPYGVSMVQAPQVWAEGYSGAGRTVCIIDTGLYQDHEDLPNAIGGVSQVDDNWARDGAGHGSHVAGTVAAIDNEVGVIGVAPGVNLYIVKIFNDDGLWTLASDLIDAIYACRDNGHANVISMSLSGTTSNRREQRAFDTLYSQGILHVAAASNEGTSALHYPASYSSVISVGAVDENMNWATFSNFNSQVELAAPGVHVLSTVPYLESNTLVVDGASYQANHIEFSGRGAASGALVDGGLCGATNTAWAGKVVLCQRGTYDFYTKVINVQNSGGAAAIIYNNVSGNFLGTLGEGNSSSIIGLSISMEDGQWLVGNKLGATASVSSSYTWPYSGYEYYDGTSMATPHVSAVAALIWSADPTLTNVEIRDALDATALDRGDPGRDVYYGYGIVQAWAAFDYLGLGGGGTNQPPVASFTYGCTDLACTFDGSASYDPDGSVASYAWDFGDGATASGATAAHTYAAAGTYAVTLTVTDNLGATGAASQDVTVTSGGAVVITLTATGRAAGPNKFADLVWSGATSAMVDIYRNDALIITTTNSGAYSDKLGKVTGTFVYKVCEAGTTVCSNEASVSW